MPRPVGESGGTGAESEARRNHQKSYPYKERTPASARTPSGAQQYAEQNTVTETTSSGAVVAGPAGGASDVRRAHEARARVNRIVHALADQRSQEAKEFRKHALNHVYATHFALDQEGRPKTKTELIPKVKTSPAAVKVAAQKFQARLSKLKIRGANQKELELFKAIESRRIAKDNYYLNVHGGIEYNEVPVPKLKTSPEALRADLHEVNSKTREIEEGVRHYSPPAPPEPEDSGDHGILGDVVGAVTSLPDPLEGVHHVTQGAISSVAGGIAHGLSEQQQQHDMMLSGTGVGRAIIGARNTALHGARTGLLTGTEYLTRPGAAIEQAIAHEIATGNAPISALVSREDRKKLGEKDASPLDVLLHGAKTKHSATGGDLAEALFGQRQLGLAVDFATDPTMWFGGAGLEAKFAERATAIASRIEKVAPKALRGEEIQRALKVASDSGDYSKVIDTLEQAAKDNKISLRFIGKTRDDKRAIAKLAERRRSDLRDVTKELSKGRKAAEDIRGHKVYVPGTERQKAVELYAKMSHEKALRPGFRIQLQTPFGRPLAGIDVPIPKAIAGKRFLYKPVSFKESSALLKSSREANVTSKVYRDLNTEIKRKTDELTALPPDAPAEARVALEKDLKELRDHVRTVAKEARLNLPSEKRVSMNEIFAGKNDKRYAHEFYRVTRSMGHDVRREFQEHVARALQPIMHSADSRARVELYMHVAGDLGSTSKLEKLVPLSKKEAQAVEDMRKVYREMERHGLDTGSLHQGIENYVPRYYTKTDNPTRPNASDVGSYQGKHVGNSTFSKHRGMPEVGSIADRASLSLVLRKLGKDISPAEAMKLADEIHNFGKVRMTMEDMARETQRGRILKEADMTDMEKSAYTWSQRMKSNDKKVPPLFRDLTTTDGQIKLHPEATKYHSFVEDPFGSMSAEQESRTKLSSAIESAGKLHAARDMHPTGSKLWEDFNKRLERRQAEVRQLRKETPMGPRRAPKVPTGTEAPTASEVGLASDAELADFIPNADETYIGGLKDFRETHEDVFPMLDPMLSNFYRARAEGIQTLYRTRWAALDKSLGRSTTEAQGGRYTLADGRSGPVSDLKPDWGEGAIHEAPVGYRIGPDFIPADEIKFDGPALIPNSAKDRWYDAHTGEEYVSPTNMLTGGTAHLGDPMMEAIGHDRIWPTRAVDNARAEFFRMGEDSQKSFYESGFEHLLGRTMTLFRYGVTTLFPAYHVRNMISDVLNSLLADPGMLFHPLANAKYAVHAMFRGPVKIGKVELLKNSVKVPGLGRLPSEDFLALMDTFGLRSPQHLAEFSEIAAQGSLSEAERWWERLTLSAKRGFGIGPSGAIGKRALEFSSRREEIVRGVTLLQRMRRNGGDFADAAQYMIKHHFDYADLTNVERRFARNVFLFYTWYRKNIPLQFASLITRPGFFSGVTNTYIDLAHGETPLNYNWSKINPNLPDMSGPVPNSALIPDYMLTQLSAITTNWNGHAVAVGFGAPWADMNLVTNMLENPDIGTRQILTLSNPAIPFLFEQATQSSLLTGADYGNKENSGSADLIDALINAVGGDGLPKNGDGEPVLPWRMMVALNAVPILGRASGYLRPTSSTEDQGKLSKLIGGGVGNSLLGLNIYVSPKEGERLDAAYINRVIARSIQRKELSEKTSGESKHEQEKTLHEFDTQTRTWAKEMGIPWKYLQVVPGIGPAYVTQEERETGFTLGGSSPLTGGSSAGSLGIKPLGGSSSSEPLGLPSVEPPKKEYESMGEEAIEKLNNPGKFLETHRLSPLTQGVSLSGEANPLAEGTQSASQTLVNAAIHRLHLNKAAREGNLKPEAKSIPKLPSAKQQREHAGKVKLPQQPKHLTVKEAAERLEAVGARPNVAMAAAQRLGKKGRDELLAANQAGYGAPENIAKVKAKHQIVHRVTKLRNEVNKGKLPQFSGFSNKDQEEFAQWLSTYTKLDPEFIGNWVAAEGGGEAGGSHPGETVSGGEAGYQNWLGVRYPAEKTPYSESHFNGSAKQAARETKEWIFGEGDSAGTPDEAAASIQEFKRMQGASAQELANYLAGPSAWGTGAITLGNVNVTGYGGKKNPGAEAKLKRAESEAKKLGINPEHIGQHENAINYGAFNKHVRRQLKFIEHGHYDKGAGEIVLSHGKSDLEGSHEPEIAARLKLLSAKLGKPVYIISGYRTPEHSVEVGGFSDDPHTKGEAADIGVGSPTLASAAEIPESMYESVGLYRPFGTAQGGSSAEDNHVQLLNNGTPRTGGSVGGGGSAPAVSGAAPAGTSGGGGAITGQSSGKGGRYSPQENVAIEKELTNLRAKTSAGSSNVSLGSGSFLSSTEAANLGPSSSGKAAAIIAKVEKELEMKRKKAPASRRYKFNTKSARL